MQIAMIQVENSVIEEAEFTQNVINARRKQEEEDTAIGILSVANLLHTSSTMTQTNTGSILNAKLFLFIDQ
jgi:hypothetical protein